MIGDKKGVTLISILIIVVVISALTSIITISSNVIMKNVYKREFKAEYYLVKSAVDDYIIRNSGNIDFEETEIDLSNISNKYLIQFEDETIIDNKIEAYEVNLNKIGVYNTTYGNKLNENADDIYVVTKDKQSVYYKKGFSNEEFIYYKAIED